MAKGEHETICQNVEVRIGGVPLPDVASVDWSGRADRSAGPIERRDLKMTFELKLDGDAFQRFIDQLVSIDRGITSLLQCARRFAAAMRADGRAGRVAALAAASRAVTPPRLELDVRKLPKRERMRVARAVERINRTAPRAKSCRRCALVAWAARMGVR